MKKILALIICSILYWGEAAAQHHNHRAHHKARHRVVRQEDKIAHDTLPEPKNIADSIIWEATKYLGIPYKYGTHGPSTYDCSGFTGHIYRLFNYNIGYASREQYLQGANISKHNLHKGDLVFFCGRQINGKVGHVGIVFDVDTAAGSFRFIHCSCSKGVNIEHYPSSKYYLQRYMGARRFIDYNDQPMAEQKEDNPLGIAHPDIQFGSKKNDTLSIAPPAETIITHTVSTGETFYTIAEKHNCSPEEVAKWNDMRLSNAALRTGKKIIIKPEEETGRIKAEKEKNALATDTSILVREGENIWTISQKYNCTVKQLADWNELKSDSLRPGQSLIIRPSVKKAEKDSLAEGVLYHKVVKGENIYTIARKYKCTKTEIKKWNYLRSNVVKPGETLMIKRFDKGNTHTIRKGEDLHYVAAKYGVSVKQLMEWNVLHTEKVKEGQIIKLSPSEKGFEKELPPTNRIDTSLTLAQQMERDELMKRNKAEMKKTADNKKASVKESTKENTKENTPDGVSHNADNGPTVGEKAHDGENNVQNSENTDSNETFIYQAVNGDNLSRIARKNHCTVKQLYEWNNLKNDRVRLGQKFIIKK